MSANEIEEIEVKAERVSEESKKHDSFMHPFKYPTNRATSINKEISINIKFPNGMTTRQKVLEIILHPCRIGKKDKDEFNGTNGAAMSTASQAEPVSEELISLKDSVVRCKET